MSFWNKSKYKKDNKWNWWEQDTGGYPDAWDDYDYGTNARSEDESYGSYSGGWGSSWGGYSWYKPKFDMSISLETRVIQLIKTVTGKSLKVAQAQGWGNNEEFFFYNPEDLKEATDDEVLGRILHELAKKMHLDTQAQKAFTEQADEKAYRHLVNTLEDNRIDAQLQERYPGCKYYAAELWDVRKFDENPMNQAKRNVWDKDKIVNLMLRDYDPKVIREFLNAPTTSDRDIEAFIQRSGVIGTKEDFEQFKKKSEPNHAWEFNFNINALQNGEEEWDFSDGKTEDNFKLAIPYIKKYLEAKSFEEALKIYPDIKKYYPKPDEEQQEEMDRGMSGMQGLSAEQMAEAVGEAIAAERAKEEGKDGDKFLEDFTDWSEAPLTNEMKEEKNLAKYKQYLAEHQPSVNVLHQLIRSILKDNTAKRYNRPFKRGKLDAKAMYKYLATDNLRIFKKQRVINEKKYAMTIVVDMSGSMRGERSLQATKGAIVLAETMEKLGFPYEVIAYNDSVYNLKKFNQPLRREIIPSIENADGNNNELDTMDMVVKHMKGFDPDNHAKKAVFWVTDGQAYAAEMVKQKVSEFEKNDNGIVFAVGIGGGISKKYLEETYNHSLKVDRIEDLPRELLGLMRSQFRRSN